MNQNKSHLEKDLQTETMNILTLAQGYDIKSTSFRDTRQKNLNSGNSGRNLIGESPRQIRVKL